MAIRLIVYMEALAGRAEKVADVYGRLVPEVRQEPGCLEFTLLRNLEHDDQFVLLERWLDQESLTAHGQALRERNLDLPSIRTISRTDRYID